MSIKSADPQTIAPRLSIVEDQAAWLLEKRGTSGPGSVDQKLWKAAFFGAQPGAWSPEPWNAEDLIYGPGSPNEVSLHQTLYGMDTSAAIKCQDGKGLYGWIFPPDETRWQYGPGQGGNVTLATDTYGNTGNGYVESLRSASLSLAKAIFKDPSFIGSYTIIDRINDLVQELETLASNVESEIERLDARIDALADR